MIQKKDDGLWSHGTIIAHGATNQNSRSYKIQITTTARMIMQMPNISKVTYPYQNTLHARLFTKIELTIPP